MPVDIAGRSAHGEQHAVTNGADRLTRVTLRDVAVEAGVSPSTVSRAINRPELLSSQTVARIREVIDRMDYQPNLIASGLRRRASRIVGLVITDIQNPFFGAVAKGVQDVAYENSYELMLFNSEEDPAKERRVLQTLSDHQAQGLVIVPTSRTRENLQRLPSMPTVEVDRTSRSTHVHAVLTNNLEVVREAVTHFVSYGHRRIGIIAGRRDVTTGSERYRGYCEALAEFGIPLDPQLVVHCRHDEESGFDAAMKLLDDAGGDRPTALFAVNNLTTVGAIRAIRELGLRIPEELSLIGFDDSHLAQLMDPPLTVVSQPVYALGYTAAQTLFHQIKSQHAMPASVTRLSSTLVVRRSVDAPPRTVRTRAPA